MEKGIYKVYIDVNGKMPYKIEKSNNQKMNVENGQKTLSLKLNYKARFLVIK